ncbi:cytochrome P450 [Microbacterium sp. RD1]|uniref:cytochrome P450 n=1 Tax=Microbacterium sp. RD1 TaxID=3457313 RepID=UPI003FA5ACC1
MTGIVTPTAGKCPFPHETLSSFDHHDPALSESRLWESYEALRASGRVAHSDRYGGFWILSSYDDVRSALRDPGVFSSAGGHRIPEVAAARAIPIDYDPPKHTAYREIMMRAIRPQRVKELDTFLRDTIRGLLGGFAAKGGGDFIADVALPLPLVVLTQIVGFSPETVQQFRRLTERIAATITDQDTQLAAREEFRATLRGEIDRHREERPDDYLTSLLDAQIDGRPLDDRELLSILNTVALAGHETTMNSAGHLFWLLANDAGLQERLRADPSVAPRYVEEMLRLRTPAQMFSRRLTQDVTIDGTTMAAGESVLLLYGSANRDDTQFDHADVFDIDRPARGHLAFGWGIHQCIGAPLARVELRMLLEEARALAPFRPGGEPEFGSIESGVHYGLRRLPLTFDREVTP